MILWIGYFVLLVVAGGLGLPPVFLIAPAAGLWDFPAAVVLCLTGGLGASAFGFLLSRHALRDWVTPKIPPKIQKFEQRLETHAFSTVIVMRLLFYLFPPINWMLGVSRISLSTFLLATFLGMLPATFLYLWAGEGLIGFLLSLSLPHSLLILGCAAVLLVLWFRNVLTSG